MIHKYTRLKRLFFKIGNILRLTRNTDVRKEIPQESLSEPAGCADSLAELAELESSGRLIKLDYPYHPRRRTWDRSTSKTYARIERDSDRYAATLEKLAVFSPAFAKISAHGDGSSSLAPRWANGWFPALDAISLYGLLALHNPRHYVEVGSGNSTMFARQAIRDHGLRTSIISVDPHPRADIDLICDQVIRSPCENVVPEILNLLSSEDIFFIDNSHRSFQNSDVTVFFSEILPNIPNGLIYGLHDIFLPWDYPDEWSGRFYNEQYLLEAYLLGGARQDEILLPNCFIAYESPQLIGSLQKTLDSPTMDGVDKTGAAFWMRRAA